MFVLSALALAAIVTALACAAIVGPVFDHADAFTILWLGVPPLAFAAAWLWFWVEHEERAMIVGGLAAMLAVVAVAGGAWAEAPTGFCATHGCVPSFEKGRGSIVQCEDGMWSRSGGLSGACSHHGGVR